MPSTRRGCSVLLSVACVLTGAIGARAQEPNGASIANPLDIVYENVTRVLAEAGVPLSEQQERAIALLIEDRRQASDDLFGETMDFSGGPVQGQDLDRALAALRWMEEEFTRRLVEYLTPGQAEALASHNANLADAPSGGGEPQTQFVRVISNSMSAERRFRGSSGGSDVIERGGTGSFHGQVSFDFQHSALNARNAFAENKPEYQQRQINATFGGPVMPGRLTAIASFSQREAQNADTVNATLPDGTFQLGIVRPDVDRSGGVRGTYQLTDRHSVVFDVRHGRNTQRNNSVGGFTLPERGSNSRGRDLDIDLRHFVVFSEALIYEQSFDVRRGSRRNQPLSGGVAVNVLDAFRGGGAQDRSATRSVDYVFGNLLTRAGAAWTMSAGFDATYRTNDDVANNNFNGTYTFSNLDDYVNGQPVTFKVTRGETGIRVTQLEFAPFVQHDWKATEQLTLMFGARYEHQTNLDDHNNLSPRVAFAWAPGRALVLRGGLGVFYTRLSDSMVQMQRRLDGSRQYEILINDPSWPDPFRGGDVTVNLPTSVRVTDPDLVAPHTVIGELSVEKTFANNLSVSAGYVRERGANIFRSRNLNAPLPGETENPDPTRGQVVQLEATGRSVSHDLRVTARQRFSLFSVNASYSFNRAFSDVPSWTSLPANNYDPGGDWGRSSGQEPHDFSATVNARLPWGLFLTGSHRWTGGTPYNVTTGRDDNNDGVTNDRPAGVPRNSATGPAFQSTSVNISKAFYLGDQGAGGSGTNLNWFVNLSNAFNVVNRGTPSGVLTSSNFGRSTSAGSPRELEVGLRFSF